MTQVWDLALGDSSKIVLLALADCANDEGWAWPSIASLCRKANKCERTVQGVIQRLVKEGHLTRNEVPGKGCRYRIHPRNLCTPAESAPAQGLRETPAESAPHPRSGCGQTVNEPSGTVKGGRAGARHASPSGDDGEESRAKPQRLPEDWQAPPPGQLPPAARRLVEQWPQGAYEAQAAAFHLHWTAEQGAKARKSDWRAALGKWMIGDHSRVMRDARAGISYAALAPASAGPGQTRAAMAQTPAKRREEGRSFALHGALRRALGEQTHDTWLAPAALLVSDGGVEVVTATAFHREWLESRLGQRIAAAASDLLGGKPWVRFDVQPVRREVEVAHG